MIVTVVPDEVTIDLYDTMIISRRDVGFVMRGEEDGPHVTVQGGNIQYCCMVSLWTAVRVAWRVFRFLRDPKALARLSAQNSKTKA